jgi:hypothetical protein
MSTASELGDFLRARHEQIRPEDVGVEFRTWQAHVRSRSGARRSFS